MLGLLWYLQRRLARRGGRRPVDAPIEVVGRAGLGGKAQVVIVQTADARYVLGVTEHGVTVVDKLAAGAEAPLAGRAAGPDAAAPAAVASPFGRILTAASHGAPMPTPAVPATSLALRAHRRGSGRSVPAEPASARRRMLRLTLIAVGVVVVGGVLAMTLGTPAHAAPVAPTPPVSPSPGPGVTIDINGIDGSPSASILTLLGITLLSVAPALLLMMSSFTKIFVVLAMTRNALSLPTIPPTQVLAGLALFLSLFIMWPVLGDINTVAVQPYVNGHITFERAVELGQGPLREWMLGFTRQQDLALMSRAAERPNPADPQSVPMYTLIPAFMISELRAAFVIGLVVFVPFLVIDLVVAAALMSMGMMMLPPVMISLPFKILLFILVDGWGLIIRSLLESYGGTG